MAGASDAGTTDGVELVLRYADALNSGVVPDGLLAPGFVMINAATAVTDDTYEGAEGVARWRRDILGAFDAEARFDFEEIVATGEDCVVTMNRIEGKGAASGAPLLFRWAAVLWFRDGQLTRAVGYLRRSEALAAAGLAS